MLTRRRAFTQQKRDQNRLSLTLGTLGGGVSRWHAQADMHRPALWPHVTRLPGSRPTANTHAQTGSENSWNHWMSCVCMNSYHMIQTLTLGATVAHRGHFLQRDFSLWGFGNSPPGQIVHLRDKSKNVLYSLHSCIVRDNSVCLWHSWECSNSFGNIEFSDTTAANPFVPPSTIDKFHYLKSRLHGLFPLSCTNLWICRSRSAP